MAKIKIDFEQTTPFQRRQIIRDLDRRLNVQQSLGMLIEIMHQYEAQYGMSTVEFYARYVAGQMGDGHDVMRWAGAFHDYQALLRGHFNHVVA